MLPDGTVVAGRFRVAGMLGAGRHGVVYRAELEGREIALKIVDEPNTERAQALVNAARRAQRIGGRGVIRVLDAGRDAGRVWVASELAAGRSLAVLLDEGGPLDTAAAVNVLVALCRALDATHAAGLLHGDLKPNNVIVGPDGNVVLTDIGLARSRGAGSGAYASPEASHGFSEDERSDLYSLGVVAYECLTGSPWSDDEDSPVAFPIGVPTPVRSVVIRLLHKDQGARFRRADDVARALVEAASGKRPRGPARRFGVGIAVAAGLVIGAVLVMRGRGEAAREVIVNGVRVAAGALSAYETKTGAHVPDGHYWYDRASGLWGIEGRPPRCVTARGQDFGATLKSGVMLVGAGVPPCPLGEDP